MATSLKLDGIPALTGTAATIMSKGIHKNLPSLVFKFVKFALKSAAHSKSVQQAISSPSFLMRTLEVVKITLPQYLTPSAALSMFALASAVAPRQMFNLAGNAANFAVRNLNRLYGSDNVDQHETNLQNLQRSNQATSEIIDKYIPLLHLLAVLSTFNPALQALEGEAEKIKKASELHLQRIQQEIQVHRHINLQEVESAILYFTAELEHAQGVHGENIEVFPKMMEELQQAEDRLEKAQKHLQCSKKEMEKTVEELKELNRLILEEGLEQDKAFEELLAQAGKLIKKSTSPQLTTSGVSHGITVES